MMEARDITVRSGRLHLVDGVSLRVLPGRIMVLLGPNGAGKSTLISVLSGERKPDGGSVTVDGDAMEALAPLAQARRRAVLLQTSSLDFAFTVAEVVSLGRLPFAATEDQRDDEIALAAARRLAGIEPLWTRVYQTLSGGERQRVQFARALAQLWRREQGPRYLLLDEPTAALDLRHRRSVLEAARGLAAERVGVLAVLHDLNLAAAFADDLVLLREGRVLAAGARADVLTSENLSRCFDVPVEVISRSDGEAAVFA
jgi:iron complex transport system ATP-binding protein